MKRLLHIFIVIIVATSLWGCGRSRTVAALVEADSLMWTRPDSSLALVQSVSPDTLDDENRAYHALLLTQAQFRNNIYPDTDTIINRALDFYADNHNRERLTRSLIYKGAIYEISQKPVDAMKLYLLAEQNASTNDYLNLASVYLRKAIIYRDYFSIYKEDLRSFQKSLHYYSELGNKPLQLFCLIQVGGLYREFMEDSAFIYLEQAKSVSRQLCDTASFVRCNEYIARQLLADSCFKCCIDTILQVMQLPDKYRLDDECLDLAYSYAVLKNVDSAEYYYGKVSDKPADAVEVVMRHYTLAKIDEAKGLYKEAYNHMCSVKSISESIISNKQNKAIYQQVLSHSDMTRRGYLNLVEKFVRYDLIYFIIALVILLVISIIVFITISAKRKKLTSYKNMVDQYEIELARIAEHSFTKLSSLTGENEALKLIVDNHILMIRHLVESSYNLPTREFMAHFNEIVKFSSKSNEYFWQNLRKYVNVKYSHIIDHIKERSVGLNEKEIAIVELTCCGFNSQEIAVCLGYHDSDSVRSLKSRIKKKLNTPLPLEQYISGFNK